MKDIIWVFRFFGLKSAFLFLYESIFRKKYWSRAKWKAHKQATDELKKQFDEELAIEDDEVEEIQIHNFNKTLN